MRFLFISRAHTLSLQFLPARCVEHVTAWESAHEVVMLEVCLADGALIVVSNIPGDIIVLRDCLRDIPLRLRCPDSCTVWACMMRRRCSLRQLLVDEVCWDHVAWIPTWHRWYIYRWLCRWCCCWCCKTRGMD